MLPRIPINLEESTKASAMAKETPVSSANYEHVNNELHSVYMCVSVPYILYKTSYVPCVRKRILSGCSNIAETYSYLIHLADNQLSPKVHSKIQYIINHLHIFPAFTHSLISHRYTTTNRSPHKSCEACCNVWCD